jgi:hypothetical protein
VIWWLCELHLSRFATVSMRLRSRAAVGILVGCTIHSRLRTDERWYVYYIVPRPLCIDVSPNLRPGCPPSLPSVDVGELYTECIAVSCRLENVTCLLHRFLKGGLLVYHRSTNTMAQTTRTNPIAITQPQIWVLCLFFLFRSIHVSLQMLLVCFIY